MKKMIELSDALSMHSNKMQTLTEELYYTGKMSAVNVLFESISTSGETILASCKMDSVKSFFLLEKESRLPFGMTRKEMVENGLDFVFCDTNSKDEGEWRFSADLNDEDNSTKYIKTVDMFSEYSEFPTRDLFSEPNLEARFITYTPSEGKTKNVDGVAIIEIGYNLKKKSGLVYYYNYRVIPETEVNYL
jgi:hypothetical protein